MTPPDDGYLAVLRLLPGLTVPELNTLRMHDIPGELRVRRGVRIVAPPVVPPADTPDRATAPAPARGD